MQFVPCLRHLLRAKDLADGRSRAHFGREIAVTYKTSPLCRPCAPP